MIDKSALWFIIIGLGIGSYLLRFTFIGLVGGRQMPPWLLRHLRYTAVAILPALVAPLVAWPAATAGARSTRTIGTLMERSPVRTVTLVNGCPLA